MGVNRVQRVMQDSNEFARFHFILDEFDARKTNTGKPETQKYRSAARQHVMRGVGLSKRKAKKSKPLVFELVPRRHTIGSTFQELQRMPQPDSSWYGGIGVPNSRQGHFGMPLITPPETPLDGQRNFWYPGQSPAQCTGLNNSRLDPFTSWAVDMTPRMRFLMDYVLTTDCDSVRLFRSVGYTLVNTDPGIQYNTLAVAAFCLSHRSPASQTEALTSEAFYYHSRGLNSINSRLEDLDGRTSDGMLTSIMAMATQNLSPSTADGWCWEVAQSNHRGRGNEDQWRLHLEALGTILADRDGIQSLDSNTAMRTWLYLIDIEGAVTRDAQPYFPLPQNLLPVHNFRWPRNKEVAAAVTTWTQEFPTHLDAIHIWLDLDSRIDHLCDQFAEQGDGLWSHNEVDLLQVVPLVHRCLQLSGKDERAPKKEFSDSKSAGRLFEDALRHAIILFLAPVRRKFGHPAAGLELHISKLKATLHKCLAQPASLLMQPILFWMLMAGALEACFLAKDECWFFSRILDCCAIMGARNFENVKEVIKFARSQLVWLDEAMDTSLTSMLGKMRVYMDAKSDLRHWDWD